MDIFKFFKPKNNFKDISLEEAVSKGFITEEEKLKITKDRAEEKLREFLLKNKKK